MSTERGGFPSHANMQPPAGNNNNNLLASQSQKQLLEQPIRSQVLPPPFPASLTSIRKPQTMKGNYSYGISGSKRQIFKMNLVIFGNGGPKFFFKFHQNVNFGVIGCAESTNPTSSLSHCTVLPRCCQLLPRCCQLLPRCCQLLPR